MPTTTRIARTVGLVAGLALSASALAVPFSPAQAAEPGSPSKPAACSQQQRQVDRAEKALDKVTAVFAKHKSRTDAKAHPKSQTKKAKKAQVQRLAKAEQRLAACQDAQDGTASS